MTYHLKIKQYAPCIIGILILSILAVLHLGDVQSGAIESGDMWLLTNYGILLACIFVCVLVLSYLWYRNTRFSIELIFLCSISMFGLLYLFVLPPLSAPDEVSHYISAYQLSNRMMGKAATHEDGHVLIRQEDLFNEDTLGEYGADHTEISDITPMVLGQTLTQETYQQIRDKGWWGISSDEPAVSRQAPVNTIPLVYVPQALGITIARLLHMSSVGLLYMGRLWNLMFYVSLTYLAIRRLPFGKEVLFGSSMLPMALHLSASMSYDAMILAGSYYFIALCLDLAYEKEKVRFADVIALAFIMAIIGPCKMVYAVLMGLCLLIPVKKFGGIKSYLLSALIVLSAYLASMFLTSMQTIASYATETESYVLWAEESGYSLSQLLHQPLILIKMFYNTIVWQAEYYHLTMLGAYLGHVDLVLDVPYILLVLFTLGLIGLALRKPEESLHFSKGQKLWIGFLCLATFSALLLSMLIAWTPTSSSVISGVQGRYFLPLLPLILLILKNDTVVLTKNTDRAILYMMCIMNAYAILRLFSIVSIRL